MIKLSVIIPSYNTCQLTLECLTKVSQVFGEKNFEVIVVDNHSKDNSVLAIQEKFPEADLIVNRKNLGFARAVNKGIKEARGEFILLLNTDALVNKSLQRVLKLLAENPEIGILSPCLVYPDGRLQANFGHYPSLGREFLQFTLLYKILPWGRVIMPNIFTRKRFYQMKEVEWLSGTCLFIRRDVFKKIGVFDQKFFMYLEDIDFCLRARKAGFKIVFWGERDVVHQHHASSKKSFAPWLYERQSLLYFWQKHYPRRKLSYQIIKLLSNIKLWGKMITNQFKVQPRRKASFLRGKSAKLKVTVKNSKF